MSVLTAVIRYLPFGINGILAGSATVFFSYIGFDAVASAAEEVYPLLQNVKLVNIMILFSL